jgi:hypothetical protein
MSETLSDGTPIVWVACSCYVWPAPFASKPGRCGKCGELADIPWSRPVEGKARPLTEEERCLV